MKRLYSIAYPCLDIANADELYIRGNRCYIENKRIWIPEGEKLDFCTYYNGFSLEKWRKYTRLSSLKLKINASGRVKIQLYTKYLTAGDYLDKLLFEQIVNIIPEQDVVFDLSEYIDLEGVLYFSITALEKNVYFIGGSYCTDDEMQYPNVGIVICTFKREKYIEKYVKNFNKNNNENLQSFIIDNGKTLSSSLETDQIKIFKNKNYGGAGGFARGMLEINKWNRKNEKKIDYILLMDDDIVIDFSVFDKLLSFLALRKEEYNNYFVAGGMCSLDYPYLQYERMASWRGDTFIQIGDSYDLRKVNTIVLNEREDKLNNCSAGWWFSCFSTKMIEQNNYPFPCFFRGDDMEFTIRNGSKIITLNGINVWHEPFYKKYSISSENYYLYRNSLVINALYYPDMPEKQIFKYIANRFLKMLVVYDYRSAKLLIRAIEDFCKGIKFFMDTNPEELNQELMKINYKLTPIEESIEEFKIDDINAEIYGKRDKNKISSIIRHITFNGLLLPKSFYKPFNFALVGFGARHVNFYCRKTVYNFDPFTKKGYFVHVSKKETIKLMIKFLRTYNRFRRNKRKIYDDYQTNFYKLQTEKFWKKYLELSND